MSYFEFYKYVKNVILRFGLMKTGLWT